MSFATLYRASFYAMLVFATLVLSVDAPDSRVAPIFPVVVAVAAVVAFLTVDRRPGMGISRLFSDLLGVGSVGLFFAEWLSDQTLLVLALGHWLVYFQLIYLFRDKTVSVDWTLFGLGLVQVVVGTVISQSDTVGLSLSGWAILALWVLGLFSLRREAIRAEALDPRAAPEPGEAYPGLLNLPFLLSGLRVTLTTLALGGVIFLAMPRHNTMARPQGRDAPGQHLTGFDDEVQLGQMGEILENDSVVMSVELFDESGERVVPEGEPLWRGVTMTDYEAGRWRRRRRSKTTFPLIAPEAVRAQGPARTRGEIRQQIKLESNDSSVLFGLRPMIEATARRAAPQLNAIDGSIFRDDARAGVYDYEVRSYRDPGLPQPGESPPSEALLRRLLDVPDGPRTRLRAIAERVIRDSLPPEKRDDPGERARALEEYLRDSGQFSYTLKLDVVDPNLDPVEDFLVNRKQGHCEYFASALALLLRSAGIPARLVNGFKGGDWNDLARVMSVRQKHAHSWVEAYLGNHPGPEHTPVWITLDPTPGNERDESVARVGGFGSHFRQVTDLVRYVWVFYVVGYNNERQQRLLYGPVRRLIHDAREGFQIMGESAEKSYARLRRLLHFPDVQSFISVRGFVVSFAGLSLLVLGYRAASWAVRRLLRWYRGPDEEAGALASCAAHYRRLAQLLAGCGLERPPAETQDEFARRANAALNAPETEAVADVPRLVVDAFYRERFGHHETEPATVKQLETRLDALEVRLQAAQQ